MITPLCRQSFLMAQAVPNLCVSRKVFLKHQVNWNTVCGAIQELSWHNIWLPDNPVEFFYVHLSLLVGRYAPTKVIVSITRISLGLMITACMLLASSRRRIYGGPAIVLRLTGKFVHCQVRDNETYSQAKRQFSDRKIDVLMNVQSPHKWWSTFKSAVFGSSSSLPPLVSESGGLVCESVGKADLLSDHFESKQSMELICCLLVIHLLVIPPLRSGRVR